MNPVMVSHRSWEWPTPISLYEELDREFKFNFDPCPLGGKEDGRSTLFCSWRGKRVFCNPPYGPEIPKFMARAHEAELAVFLVPARTDTRWFHDIVLPIAKEIRFVRGRLKFGESKSRAPFPSMIVIFSGNDGTSTNEQMLEACEKTQDKMCRDMCRTEARKQGVKSK